MDARNQARAEHDNREFSNENWEQRIRHEEAQSRRRAVFILVPTVGGLLAGLASGPVGGWHNPSVTDRLANAAIFAGVGVLVGWRFWGFYGDED